MSKNKDEIKKLANVGRIIEKFEDAIKDPYVLDFLVLPELPSYSEAELKTKIIDNLKTFSLKLGKGFAFVTRQQRYIYNEEHYKS